jgi:hypothetical protein
MTRAWGQLLDDVCEVAAATLTESWDVVAGHVVWANPPDDLILLLATNSGIKVSVVFDSKSAKPVIATGGKVMVQYDGSEIRDHGGGQLGRTVAAAQSALRLVEARSTQYDDGDAVTTIMSTLTPDRIGFVAQVDDKHRMHAEMCILHELISGEDRYLYEDETFPTKYFGVSKPCCGYCHLFFAALADVSPVRVMYRGQHGALYDRPWRVPPFVLDKRFAKIWDAFWILLKRQAPGTTFSEDKFGYLLHRKKDGALTETTSSLVAPRSPVLRSRKPRTSVSLEKTLSLI